ncbi:hypothetical protein CU098_001445, partial [Rhizopus stolonifer]
MVGHKYKLSGGWCESTQNSRLHLLILFILSYIEESFSIDSKIFTSKFFTAVCEAVFLVSCIIVDETCHETRTLLLVAIIHVIIKEVSVVVDEEEVVKQSRDLSNFATTSQNPWRFMYSMYMDNADEEEDAGSIFDDINEGEVFDWEEEEESFIKTLKNSALNQPATKKRLTSRSLIFKKFQKVSASTRISKE